eukprot:809820_1
MNINNNTAPIFFINCGYIDNTNHNTQIQPHNNMHAPSTPTAPLYNAPLPSIAEIEHMHINELFYKKNDELNSNQILGELNDAQLMLKEYASAMHEQEALRSQALDLRCTVHDTIESRCNMRGIERNNVSNLEQKKLQMMRRIPDVQNHIVNCKTNFQQIMKPPQNDILSIVKLIGRGQDGNGKANELCIQTNGLCTNYVDNRLNVQSIQCMGQTSTKTDFNRVQTLNEDKCGGCSFDTARNEKPFRCDTCNKSFKRKQTLQRHIVVHTGEKQFQCMLCHKRYTQKNSLKTHMKKHSTGNE